MTDYNKLGLVEVEQDLELIALKIDANAGIAVKAIFEIGGLLVEAREKCRALSGNVDDKRFGQWREMRLPWLHRKQALRFIQVYERFESGGTTLSHQLPSSLLIELASPSVSDEKVQEVLERTENGEDVTARKLREELKAEREKLRLLEVEAAEAKEKVQQAETQVLTLRQHNKDIQEQHIFAMQTLKSAAEVPAIEVPPPDYQEAKEAAAKALAELEEAKCKLKEANKAKDSAIKKGVQEEMAKKQEEVGKLENRLAVLQQSQIEAQGKYNDLIANYHAANDRQKRLRNIKELFVAFQTELYGAFEAEEANTFSPDEVRQWQQVAAGLLGLHDVLNQILTTKE